MGTEEAAGVERYHNSREKKVYNKGQFLGGECVGGTNVTAPAGTFYPAVGRRHGHFLQISFHWQMAKMSPCNFFPAYITIIVFF